MTEFAKTIQLKRKEKGMTLEELADKAGVVKSYLSKLENDRIESKPSESLLKKLSDILDLDFEQLLLLAGRMTKAIVEDLDIQKVELFRAMKGRRFTEQEYKNILAKLKKEKDDNKK